MANVLAPIARMTTATTGTGTVTLGSAVTGFLTFAEAGITDGQVVSYAIEEGANREVGYGTYTASGTTLSRTVVKSTNSNALVNLSGSAQVFISPLPTDLLKPFSSGAKVTFTSGSSVAHNSTTTISWPTEVSDVGGWFDSGANSRFTVPSGVAKVQVGCFIQWTAAVLVSFCQILHKDSGGTTVSGPYVFAATESYGGGNTPDINVSAGDYFELQAYHTATGSASRALFTDGRTFFQISYLG